MLATLPLELLINVVSFLNFEDFVNLKSTEIALRRILQNESISREIVKEHIFHSKEGQLADNQSIPYAAAIQRTFDRREALALARPYSALILGGGTSVVYREGVLCYVDGDVIRILDVHGAAKWEQVIDLNRIGTHVWKGGKPFGRAELLHYQDGILSFLYRSPLSNGQYDTEEAWLMAINIGKNIPTAKRVRLAMIVQNSKFFVRNDSRFLYVGTHDGMGSHRHHEWVLQGYNLSNGHPCSSLQLSDFFGTELRQTVIFEVYDGYLYAISNQSSFEVEEVDWTSYYHCCRFPLNDPTCQRLQRQKIFRRQHREGPINDSWTDVGLHKDEGTGELFISECRREWKDGVSTQQRTYYRSDPLAFTDEPFDADTGPITYPPNDPLVKMLDDKSKPLYSDPVPRIARNYQPEPINATKNLPLAEAFLLAKTKYRTFIPASSAHLDLVVDGYPPRHPTPTPPHARHWQQQLRLRIGSRILSRPINPATELLYEAWPKEDPIPNSEEHFRDRGIRLWPPAATHPDLLDLLNPAVVPDSTSRMIGDVVAVADERTLIYMPAPLFRHEGENRRIVLVNFDRGIQFCGMDGHKLPVMHIKLPENEEGLDVTLREDRAGQDKGKGKERETSVMDVDSVSADVDGSETKASEERETRDWWGEDSATHLAVGRGYRFSYS